MFPANELISTGYTKGPKKIRTAKVHPFRYFINIQHLKLLNQIHIHIFAYVVIALIFSYV